MESLSLAGGVQGLLRSIGSKLNAKPAEPVAPAMEISLYHIISFIIIIAVFVFFTRSFIQD